MTNEEKKRAAIEVAKESLENGEEEGSLYTSQAAAVH